jgi:hypothetical protein
VEVSNREQKMGVEFIARRCSNPERETHRAPHSLHFVSVLARARVEPESSRTVGEVSVVAID